MEGNDKPRRIESWKAIAEYLGKDITTAIRWEREKGLPVHRETEGKRQIVFVYSTEVDHWWIHGSSPAQRDPERDGAGHNNNSLPITIDSILGTDCAPQSCEGRSPAFKAQTIAAVAVLTLLLVGVAGWYLRTSFKRQIRAADGGEALAFTFPGSALRFHKSVIPLHGRGEMKAADLNKDGALDIVIGNFPSNGIQVMLGKGNGTFAPIQMYQGCPAAHGLDVADLDGDGFPDIVATCYDDESLAIWWGTGDGRFQPLPTRITVGRKPLYAKVADLNHDGLPDIVADATSGTSISVLINQGHRSFIRRDYDIGFPPRGITLVDLDGNGNPYIVTGCTGESCRVTRMLKGNGDGSFRQEPFPSFGEFAINLSPLNSGRGRSPDVVFAARDTNAGDWNLILVRNQGKSLSSTPIVLKRAVGPMQVLSQDFDGDGREELVVVCPWAHELSFMKPGIDGSYIESSVDRAEPYSYYIAAGDFNGDGRMDLVLSSWDNNGPSMLMLLQDDRRTTARQ